MLGLKGSSSLATSIPRHWRLFWTIAAQARLAGFEVGLSKVMCRLGLSPPAQVVAWTLITPGGTRTIRALMVRTRAIEL
jgi:hypothetical protein